MVPWNSTTRAPRPATLNSSTASASITSIPTSSSTTTNAPWPSSDPPPPKATPTPSATCSGSPDLSSRCSFLALRHGTTLNLVPLGQRATGPLARRRLYEPGHFARQLTFQAHRLASNRMLKAQEPRVEGQALVLPARMHGQLRLITRIAQHRVPSFGEMHANLVTPARFQPYRSEEHTCEPGHDAKMRDGKLPDRLVLGRKSVQVLVGR